MDRLTIEGDRGQVGVLDLRRQELPVIYANGADVLNIVAACRCRPCSSVIAAPSCENPPLASIIPNAATVAGGSWGLTIRWIPEPRCGKRMAGHRWHARSGYPRARRHHRQQHGKRPSATPRTGKGPPGRLGPVRGAPAGVASIPVPPRPMESHRCPIFRRSATT